MRFSRVILVEDKPVYLKSIIRIGRSRAITLPADWFWEVGDVDKVILEVEGENLIIRPYKEKNNHRD